ncbi:uncharacterized protein LOC122053992 [Zingiber officinale]|uniref:uncharacterized protein LOC122053992 n=1 Tax=Zingiber officinale TaxID=94328 RepID=UPI001C4D38ED|nr:uncharacterized protein LOC122053992 [Zingiber officinale]
MRKVKVRMMVLTWVMMMMLRNLKMNQRLLGKNQPLRNLLLFQHHPKMLKGNCQRSSLRKKKWQSWMHFYMKWALQIKIVILHKMRQLTRSNWSKVVKGRRKKVLVLLQRTKS